MITILIEKHDTFVANLGGAACSAKNGLEKSEVWRAWQKGRGRCESFGMQIERRGALISQQCPSVLRRSFNHGCKSKARRPYRLRLPYS